MKAPIQQCYIRLWNMHERWSMSRRLSTWLILRLVKEPCNDEWLYSNGLKNIGAFRSSSWGRKLKWCLRGEWPTAGLEHDSFLQLSETSTSGRATMSIQLSRKCWRPSMDKLDENHSFQNNVIERVFSIYLIWVGCLLPWGGTPENWIN